MKKAFILSLTMIFFFILLAGLASAQVVRLKVTGGGMLGQGTAFCIGATEDGGAVFLTARHNFRESTKAEVRINGRWIKIRSVNKSKRHDVASFETDVPCHALRLAASPAIGATVEIPGFGPEYNGRQASHFRGVLETTHVAGENGLHPIPGDSGAPVVQNGSEVIGVVYGYDSPQTETAYRNDYAEQRLPTRYEGLNEIRECLEQCYQQCPPGGCRIWIRNEYRQPVGPLGFARGPVQRVPVAELVPRVWVPEDSVQQQQPPEVVQGPPGPPGRDGRSVSREEVESVVNAWLEANRESLVGPQGPPGPAGSTANLTQIEGRLTTLENRPFRIILSSDGKVVDDETYRPGEPVVLDLKRLRSVSSGN
jgi:hypothetical protein